VFRVLFQNAFHINQTIEKNWEQESLPMRTSFKKETTRPFRFMPTNLAGDLSAGVIVAVLLVPQSMAYAIIAGVPPVLGIYAATFPLLIYLMFGSSRHLSVGPVSIASILAFNGVTAIAGQNSKQFYELLFTQGFLIGLSLLLLGILNFRRLFDHLSHEVITGFTAAAVIVIGLHQLDALLGISLSHDLALRPFLAEATGKLSDANPLTICLGGASLAGLYIFKKISPLSFGPLLIVIFSILTVKIFSLQHKGVATIGDIPTGLPKFNFIVPNMESIQSMLPSALGIALIVFLESYAVAKSIADKEEYRIQPNRELIGLGLANLTSSLLGSIPVAGAFSRTAVNYRAGAKTKLASLITVCILFVCLMFLTPLLHDLPKAALGAIILYAVAGLIDIKAMYTLLKKEPLAGFIMLITFFSTLFVSVLGGLLIGVSMSLLTSFALNTLLSSKNNPLS
jgi:SulP family sulfate permease